MNPVARNLPGDGEDCIFLPAFANLSFKTENEENIGGHNNRSPNSQETKRHASLAEARPEYKEGKEKSHRRSKSLHISRTKERQRITEEMGELSKVSS